jgi:hypothetical protein
MIDDDDHYLPPMRRDPRLLVERVRAAVEVEPFSTARDVARSLRAGHASVASTLRVLADRGEVERLPAGRPRRGSRGRAPAWVYRTTQKEATE